MNFTLTVIATVFSGTLVFIIGQVIVVLFLERIRTQARCIEDIAQALTLYRPLYLEVLVDDGYIRRVTASPALHYPPGSESDGEVQSAASHEHALKRLLKIEVN